MYFRQSTMWSNKNYKDNFNVKILILLRLMSSIWEFMEMLDDFVGFSSMKKWMTNALYQN